MSEQKGHDFSLPDTVQAPTLELRGLHMPADDLLDKLSSREKIALGKFRMNETEIPGFGSREQSAESRQQLLKSAPSAENPTVDYWVVDKASQQIVGIMGAYPGAINGAPVAIMINIQKRHRGLGHATNAIKALTKQLFQQSGIPAVAADVNPRNRASLNTMEKVGFTRMPRAHVGFITLILQNPTHTASAAPTPPVPSTARRKNIKGNDL